MRLKILPPVLLLMSSALWAQSETELLESRLSAAQGADRLELLAELTTAYHMDDATRAVASGTEALELLRSYPDDIRELSVLNYLVYAHVSLGDYPQALQLGARAEHRRYRSRPGPRAKDHRVARGSGLGRVRGDRKGFCLPLHPAGESAVCRGFGRSRRDYPSFENEICE